MSWASVSSEHLWGHTTGNLSPPDVWASLTVILPPGCTAHVELPLLTTADTLAVDVRVAVDGFGAQPGATAVLRCTTPTLADGPNAAVVVARDEHVGETVGRAVDAATCRRRRDGEHVLALQWSTPAAVSLQVLHT